MGQHEKIELLSYSEVEEVSGYVGNFKVKVRKKARYVNEKLCTGCGLCEEKCPAKGIPSEFDLGLGTRKAIYRPFPQAVPAAFTIDKRGISPCKGACPIGTSAQGYIALLAEGRFQEALEVSRRVNPFTSVCGRICYHPCEEACSRNKIDQPVSIAALKRFLADYAAQHGDQPVEPVEVTREERVAVVGSGPA
ncbi:MAG: 4Fe-4S binding protein, partial [Anaerolineae bacterium]